MIRRLHVVVRAPARERPVGRPSVVLLAAVLLSILLPPRGVPALAFGAPVVYQRADRSFNGVAMRSRGFLQDNCIQIFNYPCFTYDDSSYRAEGTAQARAIQQLAYINDHKAAPLRDRNQSTVQWEVAPNPDETWGPSGPPDLNDPDCSATGRWRIDIAVDKSSQGVASDAYEVKDWSVGRAAARAQLSCYLKRVDAAGIPMVEGKELAGWVRTYPDWNGNTWCTWGDQVDSADPNAGPGLIFFAPITDATIPAFVRNDVFGGCRQPIDPLPARCRQENNGQTCFELTAALALLLLIALESEDSGKAQPVPQPALQPGFASLQPFAQVTDSSGVAQWSVVVRQDPSRPLTVLIDSGLPEDSATFTVPAGTGFTKRTFRDPLPAGFGLATTRVIVRETGQEWAALTAEDSNLLTPGLMGTPTTLQCPNKDQTVSVSGTHGLALSGGDVWSWGDNTWGELGRVGSSNPTPTLVPGLHSILSVAAGPYFSLALRSDGTLWAWGINRAGQLGNATITDNDVSSGVLQYAAPTLVPIFGVTSFAATPSAQGNPDGSSVAATRDGSVWAWGTDSQGVLGDGIDHSNGAVVRQGAPLQVTIGGSAVTVGMAWDHALAVDTQGQLWGWGSAPAVNAGPRSTFLTPTAVLAGVSSGTAGAGFTAATMADGTVQTWGSDGGESALGQDFFPPLNANGFTPPGPVHGLSGPVATTSSAGAFTSLALLQDGTVNSWGQNFNGALGIGNPSLSQSPTAVALPGLSGVTEVWMGSAAGLALKGDGSLLSWGDDRMGQLGNGTSGNTVNASPQPVGVSAVDQPFALCGASRAGTRAPAANAATATHQRPIPLVQDGLVSSGRAVRHVDPAQRAGRIQATASSARR
jgi:alpha-tubulin suppressor-like RCC1 family protein